MKKYLINISFIIFFFLGKIVNAQNQFPAGTFTLPAGKSITITYEVDVNADACAGTIVTNLISQGTVTGSNFPTVLTDDPSVAGTTNPTITPFTPLTLPNTTNILVTHNVSQPQFVNGCEILSTIVPSGLAPVSGNMDVRAWLETGTFSVLKRHYEITPTAGSSATITLYYSQADFTTYNSENLALPKLPIDATDAANNKDNLKLIKYPGTSPNGLPGGYSPNTPVEVSPRTVVWDAAGYWKVTFDVSSFSGFFVKTGSAPLPVNLISFKGKATEKGNELNWKTSNEKNFSHFEIERSIDTKKFEKIGSHTSNESGNYVYLDSSNLKAETSIQFYRLKMIDLDSKFSFSKIISMENKTEKVVVGNFYPNPSSGKSFVEITALEKSNWNITTYDLTGKLLNSEIKLLQKGVNKVSIEKLNQGVNFVRFEWGIVTEIRKIMKE